MYRMKVTPEWKLYSDDSYTRKYSWKDRKAWEGAGGRYIRDGPRFYKQK